MVVALALSRNGYSRGEWLPSQCSVCNQNSISRKHSLILPLICLGVSGGGRGRQWFFCVQYVEAQTLRQVFAAERLSFAARVYTFPSPLCPPVEAQGIVEPG